MTSQTRGPNTVSFKVANFFDELKRLNKSPDIKFGKISPINGGGVIIVKILKKYNLKHALPLIDAGTTALYYMKQNKNKSVTSTPTPIPNPNPTICCKCLASYYPYSITPTGPNPIPTAVNGIITIPYTYNGVSETQTYTGELMDNTWCTSTNPSGQIQGAVCASGFCQAPNNLYCTSPTVASYDGALAVARSTNNFVVAPLAKGKYMLKVGLQ
jgi:hypothetical protein